MASATDERKLYAVAMEGSFYLIAYCCALRGEEVPLSDLYRILSHWNEGEIGSPRHVVIALLGQFKGESGENYHLVPIVDVTSRGLEPRKWIGRLLDIYIKKDIQHGPLFRDSLGH
jgi:hypothetical protein